jgi:hypothetical protein
LVPAIVSRESNPGYFAMNGGGVVGDHVEGRRKEFA